VCIACPKAVKRIVRSSDRGVLSNIEVTEPTVCTVQYTLHVSHDGGSMRPLNTYEVASLRATGGVETCAQNVWGVRSANQKLFLKPVLKISSNEDVKKPASEHLN
jgi:hypothetical protein